MNTVNVCVIFNYNSYFHIELSGNTTFRTMFYNFPVILKRKPTDLLYFICNGVIIGSDPTKLDITLNMFGLTEKRCTVHLIFKIPNNAYKYTDNDILSSHNAVYYPIHEPSTSAVTRLMQEMLSGTRAGDTSNVSVLPLAMVDSVVRPAYNLDEICSICNDTADNENHPVVTSCGHYFHNECISNWLTTTSASCPVCNYDTRNLQSNN